MISALKKEYIDFLKKNDILEDFFRNLSNGASEQSAKESEYLMPIENLEMQVNKMRTMVMSDILAQMTLSPCNELLIVPSDDKSHAMVVRHDNYSIKDSRFMNIPIKMSLICGDETDMKQAIKLQKQPLWPMNKQGDSSATPGGPTPGGGSNEGDELLFDPHNSGELGHATVRT